MAEHPVAERAALKESPFVYVTPLRQSGCSREGVDALLLHRNDVKFAANAKVKSFAAKYECRAWASCKRSNQHGSAFVPKAVVTPRT